MTSTREEPSPHEAEVLDRQKFDIVKQLLAAVQTELASHPNIECHFAPSLQFTIRRAIKPTAALTARMSLNGQRLNVKRQAPDPITTVLQETTEDWSVRLLATDQIAIVFRKNQHNLSETARRLIALLDHSFEDI